MLRAYRGILGDAVPRRRRRSLRRIAEATSTARDAEVQRAWLRREARSLAGEARAAATALADELLDAGGSPKSRRGPTPGP